MTRTEPTVAVFSGALCCSTKGSKNESLQIPPPGSLGIADGTATAGPSDAGTNGRVRADFTVLLAQNYAELEQICIYPHVKSKQKKEVVPYLHAVLCWPLEDGWGGGAGVKGCGATPGDRDSKRSLLWLAHRWAEIKGSHLTCFHRNAALVLHASRHDDGSPPSTFTVSEGSRTAALLSPGARTDGRKGRGQTDKKEPPLHESANHTAGSPWLTREDI